MRGEPIMLRHSSLWWGFLYGFILFSWLRLFSMGWGGGGAGLEGYFYEGVFGGFGGGGGRGGGGGGGGGRGGGGGCGGGGCGGFGGLWWVVVWVLGVGVGGAGCIGLGGLCGGGVVGGGLGGGCGGAFVGCALVVVVGGLLVLWRGGGGWVGKAGSRISRSRGPLLTDSVEKGSDVWASVHYWSICETASVCLPTPSAVASHH